MRLTTRTNAAASLALFLPQIDPNAATVLTLRYGLGGLPKLTQQQTAERLKITAAQVYRAEHEGLRMLRFLMGVS